jgi:hypothetical protein
LSTAQAGTFFDDYYTIITGMQVSRHSFSFSLSICLSFFVRALCNQLIGRRAVPLVCVSWSRKAPIARACSVPQSSSFLLPSRLQPDDRLPTHHRHRLVLLHPSTLRPPKLSAHLSCCLKLPHYHRPEDQSLSHAPASRSTLPCCYSCPLPSSITDGHADHHLSTRTSPPYATYFLGTS